MGYLIKTILGAALFLGGVALFNVKLVELLETGTCASGNVPYEIAPGYQCPDDTGTDILLMVAGIFGGLIGAGITGLFASPGVSSAEKQKAESILRAVGEVVWLADEKLIDPVTAVSASGPAYVFWFIEQLAAAASNAARELDTSSRRVAELGNEARGQAEQTLSVVRGSGTTVTRSISGFATLRGAIVDSSEVMKAMGGSADAGRVRELVLQRAQG